MADRTAVIIGVGPQRGLGARLCQGFAREDLHVFVAGRTEAKLRAVADAINAEGGTATAVVTDATREREVVALFERAAAEGPGPIDLAIYNAGNNMPGGLLDLDAARFEECWRIGCFGGFLFGREAARGMLPNGAGTVLFTGASASMRGRPNFYAFTAAKGALRNFAQAMARDFGPQGIHVAHVVIDGGIAGDKIEQRWPELAKQRGEDGLIGLDAIVDAFRFLYRQPRNGWSHELDLRVHKEPF
ncbi:MAG: SDR family NAD(P)-dependent oxidoreductase [Gammaproteobacteria bacterium]|nr:SDR family NAD(P)-dependent oxidoreductase [Gammaproteobacteria bacterium]